MRIPFMVAGQPLEFWRSPITGKATLQVDGRVVTFQKHWNLRSHLSFRFKRAWRYRVNGQELFIEQLRPRLLGAVRPKRYRVLLDGHFLADARGY